MIFAIFYYIGKIKFFLYNKAFAHNFTNVKLAHEQRRGRCKFKSRTKLKEPAFVLVLKKAMPLIIGAPLRRFKASGTSQDVLRVTPDEYADSQVPHHECTSRKAHSGDDCTRPLSPRT